MSKTQMASVIDDLERKLRRLRDSVESGRLTDGKRIGAEIRKILRNEVDDLDSLIRRL